MAARRSPKLTFPANIHQIAADIRRQALQHPERDPVVPGERPARPARKKRATPRAKASAKKQGTRARKGSAPKRTRGTRTRRRRS